MRKLFNFVQMTLEDEEEEEERRRGQEEVTFSPVLIWKPGRRNLMKKHHRRSDTAPQEHRGEGRVGSGGRRRNPITLKTTDLADALPPERSDEAMEKKVCISTTCPHLCTCQSAKLIVSLWFHVLATVWSKIFTVENIEVLHHLKSVACGWIHITSLEYGFSFSYHIPNSFICRVLVHKKGKA